MKNIFSTKLYLQGLRKIRTAGVAMGIVIAVLNAWLPIQCIVENSASSARVELAAGIFAPFGAVLMVFAPLLVYNMFSYLNERKSSDFFHALPQKRICVYFSFMAAVMTWIVATLFVTSVANAVLWGVPGRYVFDMREVLMILLGFLLLAMVSAGFMMLAMTLTGTVIANVLVFFLFSLFVRAFGLFFLYGFKALTPMANLENSFLRIFDWEFFLPIGLFVQMFGGDFEFAKTAWLFLYWFFVAVLLFAVSAVCYCRRRSESATKSAPSRFMQHIYRTGVTLPFLLLGICLYIEDGAGYAPVLCWIVGFLVWVIFELMTTKRIKNVARTLPLFLIPVLLAGGYAASVHLTSEVFYATTPKREQIKSVTYDSGEESGWLAALMTTVKVSDPDVLDRVYEAIEQTKEARDMSWSERKENGFVINETVTVTFRSGRRVTYDLTSSIDLFEAFRYADEVMAERLLLDDIELDDVYLSIATSEAQRTRVWDALADDFRSMTREQMEDYLRASEGTQVKRFSLYVSGRYNGMKFWQSFFIDEQYTPKAMDALLECLAEKDTLHELREIISEISQTKYEEILYANIQVDDGSGKTIYSSNFNVIKAFLKNLEIDDHLIDYENAEYVYTVFLNIEWRNADIAYDTPLHTTTFYYEEDVKPEHAIRTELYLTLSKEDVELLRQIISGK